MTETEEKRMIRVIICRPGEKVEAAEIEDTLETMQGIVGGLIQEFMPFTGDDPREDDIAIVCDNEGKLKGAPLNRGITDVVHHHTHGIRQVLQAVPRAQKCVSVANLRARTLRNSTIGKVVEKCAEGTKYHSIVS